VIRKIVFNIKTQYRIIENEEKVERKLETKSDLQLVGSQESVNPEKLIKYKEISYYIEGEMLEKDLLVKLKNLLIRIH
jgi:hypothetical protein